MADISLFLGVGGGVGVKKLSYKMIVVGFSYAKTTFFFIC